MMKNGLRVSSVLFIHHTGEPFIGDPRNALIRALHGAEEMGFSFKTGMELEFFLFNTLTLYGKPILEAPQDSAGYFDHADEKSAGGSA